MDECDRNDRTRGCSKKDKLQTEVLGQAQGFKQALAKMVRAVFAGSLKN